MLYYTLLCICPSRVDDDIPMQACEPYTLHLTKLSEDGDREDVYDECRPAYNQDDYATVRQT